MTEQMTWEEFVRRVDAQLAAKGLSRSAIVDWIDWSRGGFGGLSVPDVYVNVLQDSDGHTVLGIGED